MLSVITVCLNMVKNSCMSFIDGMDNFEKYRFKLFFPSPFDLRKVYGHGGRRYSASIVQAKCRQLCC